MRIRNGAEISDGWRVSWARVARHLGGIASWLSLSAADIQAQLPEAQNRPRLISVQKIEGDEVEIGWRASRPHAGSPLGP